MCAGATGLSDHDPLQVWVRDAFEAQYFLDYRTGRVWHKEQVHQMPCCASIQRKAMLVFTAFVTLSYWSLTVIMTTLKANLSAACLLGCYLRVQSTSRRVVCKVCGHVRITDSQPCITNMKLLPICFAHVSCKGAQHLLSVSAQVIVLNAKCYMRHATC